MKRNRRGDPLDSPSEFSARSALTWTDDGQTRTIETPQLKATGVGLMLIGAGCLIVAFLRPRLVGTSHGYESMAKIVIVIDGAETDLTGASGTDFADSAQNAVRQFLDVS